MHSTDVEGIECGKNVLLYLCQLNKLGNVLINARIFIM